MADRNEELEKWRLVGCKLSRLFVHDLKNPISALSANLNFLETTQLEESEDIRGAVNDSILAANMLLRLADNFDMIALLESGEQSPSSHINLADFIRSAVRRNMNLAASGGIQLVLKEPIPGIFQYWQNRYAELVVDNLIMAAIRNSPPNGQVIVSLSRTDDGITFSICDQGPRIADEYVEGLFTRESQVRAKKSTGCRYGRGLGLYAVGLALMPLDGRVDIGERNGMTAFDFIVPLGGPPGDE